MVIAVSHAVACKAQGNIFVSNNGGLTTLVRRAKRATASNVIDMAVRKHHRIKGVFCPRLNGPHTLLATVLIGSIKRNETIICLKNDAM